MDHFKLLKPDLIFDGKNCKADSIAVLKPTTHPRASHRFPRFQKPLWLPCDTTRPETRETLYACVWAYVSLRAAWGAAKNILVGRCQRWDWCGWSHFLGGRSSWRLGRKYSKTSTNICIYDLCIYIYMKVVLNSFMWKPSSLPKINLLSPNFSEPQVYL